MIKKDVTSISTFLDTVGKYLLDNIKNLRDAIPSHYSLYELFKQCLGSNPTHFIAELSKVNLNINTKKRKTIA